MLITLYGLHIGGSWNEGYLDSVHSERDAFKYSMGDDDTVVELRVPQEVADRLFDFESFSDGYDRFNYAVGYLA